jgi:hypothetical protein
LEPEKVLVYQAGRFKEMRRKVFIDGQPEKRE